MGPEKDGIYLRVLVHGKDVKEYPHENRTYVEGRKGSEYTLRINNGTFKRILVVVTVDGLSVMDGKEGSYNSGGYVIGPRSAFDIPGWRLDNSEVARFFFAKREEAYASLTHRPTNIGVIGCAVFTEKVRPLPLYYDHPKLWENAPYRGDNTKSLGNVGTGFGERTEHRVTEVSFAREETPYCVFEIHYDDREGLETRGIDLRERPQIAVANPFPQEKREAGCVPPSGWEGSDRTTDRTPNPRRRRTPPFTPHIETLYRDI